MRHRPIAAVFALTLLTAACDEGPPDTCGLANDEVSVAAVVVGNGAKLRAEIDFERGDRTGLPAPLHVCADDELTIEGQSPTLTEKADRVVYSVTLPVDTSTEVQFSLTRSEADTVEVTVPRPPPFAITAPEDGATVSRSEDIVLTWEPALEGGEMRISVDELIGYGLCVVTEEGEHHYKTRAGVPVPDTGQWTIPAGAVTSETEGPCSAFYNLRRVRRSPYPETLAPGGFLEARVRRTVEIRSVP